MANCIMCGKEHTGDYYVCNACIAEYNLTNEQLLEMGGLRNKTENSENVSFKENTSQKNTMKSAQISAKTQKNTKSLDILIISMIILSCIITFGILMLNFGSVNKSDNKPKSNYSSADTPVSKEENTPQLTKLVATYDGSTEEDTDLDEYNSGIKVYATYGTGSEAITNEVTDYAIENPTTLKAGKTSTIIIHYENMAYELSIKCTSLTAKKYKENCKSIQYKKLCRTPDKYEGKKLKFTGKIFQVIEEDYYTCYLIEVTKGEYGIWDDRVYVEYWGDSEKRLLEDDIVTFYGESQGLHTYESVLGKSITVPSIDAKYFTLKSK